MANFTWIKSELTFDGLKQIKFEPSERVSLDKLKPDEKNGYHVIDHVKFTQKSKHKDYTNIVYFNPNLNAIIGGRSNGKSTLTNSIAKASGNERFNNINSENVNTNMHVFSNSNLEIYWQDTNDLG
ncbi:hypothetical protein [Pediococcus pentosaceus]|uniref:hypothetical protein n=1 Tax=Pediococcus pentosaceus TaxID=1255 RepID=UPI003D808C7C